jgi:hypothetical protein
LDRRLDLRTRGHRQQATEPGDQPLPNSTDLSLTLFEKTPIYGLSNKLNSESDPDDPANQLILFDY